MFSSLAPCLLACFDFLLLPTSSLHQPRQVEESRCRMESERDEELRVLFAAAEKGRADIINTVVEALATAAGAYSCMSP